MNDVALTVAALSFVSSEMISNDPVSFGILLMIRLVIWVMLEKEAGNVPDKDMRLESVRVDSVFILPSSSIPPVRLGRLSNHKDVRLCIPDHSLGIVPGI